MSDRSAFSSAWPGVLGRQAPGDVVHCGVCPHHCAIPPGGVGVCGVRGNDGGRLVNLAYGRVAALGIEPVEKKPIFHYYPSHRTLSLGAVGCNLHCDFCQNWEISQVAAGAPVAGRTLSPDEVVAAAVDGGCLSICFTFTEAVVNLEYVIDVARLARAAGVRVMLLTGGYISPAALALLAPWVDAVKVDLKGADDAFYRRHVGCRLGPVLAALREWRESAWVEVSTVVLPGLNDAADDVDRVADIILETIGPSAPWHLMRFFPSFRMSRAMPGALSRLRAIRERAMNRGLRHVYVSNVPGLAESYTICHACGEVVIRRGGGRLVESRVVGGCCPVCGEPITGHGLGSVDVTRPGPLESKA